MSTFWQVFCADALFSVAMLVCVTIPLTIGVALWRKRKKAGASKGSPSSPSRRAIFLDPPSEVPGKCPLCGQAWPVEGPIYPKKEEGPK